MRISSLLFALASAQNSFAALSFGFPYGTTKVRGVNLGGWLVLEVGRFLLLLVDFSNNQRLPVVDHTFPLRCYQRSTHNR